MIFFLLLLAEITDSQRVEYFKIRAEFSEAQVEQVAAQKALDGAQKKMESSRAAYTDWLKKTCSGKEPTMDSKGYPASCPEEKKESNK